MRSARWAASSLTQPSGPTSRHAAGASAGRLATIPAGHDRAAIYALATMTTAPQRLRRELEQQRERGRPFRVAWPIALSKALADLPLQQAIFWRSVFTEQ